MDHNRKKRPRTASEGDNPESRSKHLSDKKKKAKKSLNDNITDCGSTSYISPDHDSNVVSPGVFDFPWLKDGVVSKSDDWKFEDAFLSQLNETNTNTNSITTTTGIEFSYPGQCLFQTPVEAMLDFPEEKFDQENEWSVLEDDGDGLEESLDCVWSSLLNQPLRQHN
ncbi:uncharacterized protein LOC133794678 [Humulus lupulus]|uniref:uncharacterized protein LOC133794678 n=1 Tax=Humulus lupulus TaxID=3486 RepID=UPI002B40B96A|nr:uncharacterized protein LOC133794678 [Humulus lupulus]XP_062088018.1 uncharacterized protein LOC133794678 [Humulus lupulus]XP_062088019.1 uncharacterized protein LOC133794678 [Humulus lupulus]